MKKIIPLFLMIFSTTLVVAQFKYDKSKIDKICWTPIPEKVTGLEKHILELNGEWKFSSKPKPEFYKESKTNGWDNIKVPGEWVMQGFNVSPGEYAGYYKTFNLLPSWEKHLVKLKCEAIYSECSIWVNGKLVGSHLGGFTPFEFDISEFVKQKNNRIAIAVRSESTADTLSSGSKYAVHQLGGITRSIYLMAVPTVSLKSFHINTTFDKSFEDANLNVEIITTCGPQKPKEANLQFALTDTNGNTLPIEGEINQKIDLKKNSSKNFLSTFIVRKPLKWDCEHPNLYYLTCKIFVDGKEVEKVVKRFGFRQIEVRGNQLYVNNKVIKLKGVNRHEVSPLRGRSLTGNQWYEDVKIFKEGNVNYIRTSHYPPSEKFLEACDEIGMFVEEEAPFCWQKKII